MKKYNWKDIEEIIKQFARREDIQDIIITGAQEGIRRITFVDMKDPCAPMAIPIRFNSTKKVKLNFLKRYNPRNSKKNLKSKTSPWKTFKRKGRNV